MVPGSWTMVHGVWIIDHGPYGPWSMDNCPWAMGFGPWIMAHGPCPMVHGPWIMDAVRSFPLESTKRSPIFWRVVWCFAVEALLQRVERLQEGLRPS